MAKKKKTVATKQNVATKSIGGPFLAAAVFCETIVEDSSGMLSAMHILDNVTIGIPPQMPMPSKKQPAQIALNALIMFKRGAAKSTQKMKIYVESPNGKRKLAVTQDVPMMSEPHGGANIKTRINLGVFSSGLFWFDIILGGKLMSRAPLKVDILQVTNAGGSVAIRREAEPAKK